MSYEIELIQLGRLARYWRQSLVDMLGRALTWLDRDILLRVMAYDLEKLARG